MSEDWSAPRWANALTLLLDQAFGGGPDRFPVKVPELAREYSHQRFPSEPITLIAGETLPRFDGGLFKAPAGALGWGIIYNSAITSPGRIAFTLCHEFGHYLAHRLAHPNGLRCSSQDMVRWDSAYGQIEREANVFAASVLMPLNDFRRQVAAKSKPKLDDLGTCASRYGVSLIAAALQWLNYTERRSALVVSRDGFILWARSSEKAHRTGAFFRTANRPPVAIPIASLAARASSLSDSDTIEHPAGVWSQEPCEEQVLLSDRYDFTISLLHFGDAPAWSPSPDDGEGTLDAFDFMDRNRRRWHGS